MTSAVLRLAAALAIALAATQALAQGEASYGERLGELVNRHREAQGLAPLAADGKLDELAREHSAQMATSGRLDHSGFQSRFRRSGYGLCVENVGWNYDTPLAQIDAWRKSQGHARNLRDARVSRMGAGEVAGYVTWIACR
jgi:uncharacterized protein YkwD